MREAPALQHQWSVQPGAALPEAPTHHQHQRCWTQRGAAAALGWSGMNLLAPGTRLWAPAACAGILVFLWLLEEIHETNTPELRWVLLPSPRCLAKWRFFQDSAGLLVTCLCCHLNVVDFKIRIGYAASHAPRTASGIRLIASVILVSVLEQQPQKHHFSWTDLHFWTTSSTIHGLFKHEHQEFLLE